MTDFSHLPDTTLDFYRTPDETVIECSDGTVDDDTLENCHDDLLALLEANGAGRWTYGEIHCYPSRNELSVEVHDMDFELSDGSTVEHYVFVNIVKAFENNEIAADVLTGLNCDSYADLATEDPDHTLVRTYYYALNPQLL